MGEILIRDLDDGLLADYRRVAEDGGRSLEAELRDALARGRPRPPATRLSPAELLALSRELRAMTSPASAAIDSTPYIRSMRDEA